MLMLVHGGFDHRHNMYGVSCSHLYCAEKIIMEKLLQAGMVPSEPVIHAILFKSSDTKNMCLRLDGIGQGYHQMDQ